ncbi:hypothetical protein [Streptomyces sp. NPDC048489]
MLASRAAIRSTAGAGSSCSSVVVILSPTMGVVGFGLLPEALRAA